MWSISYLPCYRISIIEKYSGYALFLHKTKFYKYNEGEVAGKFREKNKVDR